MRHRPTKKQRKEALAVARAQLVLALQDGDYRPSMIEQAMQWNLAKTREALRHMDTTGSLPYQFMSAVNWRDEINHSADAAVYSVSLVDAVIKEKIAKLADAVAKDMAAASLDK